MCVYVCMYMYMCVIYMYIAYIPTPPRIPPTPCSLPLGQPPA